MTHFDEIADRAELKAQREIIAAVRSEIEKAQAAGLSSVILYAADLMLASSQRAELGGGYCDRPDMDEVLAQSTAWLSILDARISKLDRNINERMK